MLLVHNREYIVHVLCWAVKMSPFWVFNVTINNCQIFCVRSWCAKHSNHLKWRWTYTIYTFMSSGYTFNLQAKEALIKIQWHEHFVFLFSVPLFKILWQQVLRTHFVFPLLIFDKFISCFFFVFFFHKMSKGKKKTIDKNA